MNIFLRWLFAAVHVVGFGIALAAVWQRARALKVKPLEGAALAEVFRADTWWGVSAVILLGTGIPRAVTTLAKGPFYYMHNPLFHTKMTLVLIVLLLEIVPMVALIKWRIRARKGELVDTSRALAFAKISTAQAHLVIVIVLLATALARGLGGS